MRSVAERPLLDTVAGHRRRFWCANAPRRSCQLRVWPSLTELSDRTPRRRSPPGWVAPLDRLATLVEIASAAPRDRSASRIGGAGHRRAEGQHRTPPSDPPTPAPNGRSASVAPLCQVRSRSTVLATERCRGGVGWPCRSPRPVLLWSLSSGLEPRAAWRHRGGGLCWQRHRLLRRSRWCCAVRLDLAPRPMRSQVKSPGRTGRTITKRRSGLAERRRRPPQHPLANRPMKVPGASSGLSPAFDDSPGVDVRCRSRTPFRQGDPVSWVRRSCRDDHGLTPPCELIAVVGSHG